jgi:hypothetical protein
MTLVGIKYTRAEVIERSVRVRDVEWAALVEAARRSK